ncbi:FHA domain-containing protein [Micromonospora sp. NBC_01739]|uniref:FHA domain-containing protein n=1 Tax=unclassified Micromonospora TaxID=2617518 RepID=UPI002E124E1F|nr:FHA domain-containing protein [Micromonospora sp. NBC_01739]
MAQDVEVGRPMEQHPQLLPLLTVATGPLRGLSFRLRPHPMVIGRDAAADIVVHDPHLSRRHAEVRLTGAGVRLVDLGSTNGTWVNGLRTAEAVSLTDGDMILIGRTELRFFDPALARTDPVGLSFGMPLQDRRSPLVLPTAAADLAPGRITLAP